MKKMIVFLLLVTILAGCSGKSTLETMGNPCSVEPVHEPAEVLVDLPDELTQSAFKNENNDNLYLCDDYSVSIQTLPGGDLDKTMHSCTGFCIDDLTIIETSSNGMNRYDTVCSTLGEGQEQIFRTAIIDDGVFHYVVSAMTEAENAGKCSEAWKEIFSSIRISTDQ